MDISGTLAPNSEQLDAVDLLSGPRVFTIERVTKGDDEQPVQIHLADFPRAWRPGKSMRRVLVSCWGPDAAKYAGRRVELFCDTSVVFGGQAVGGTRISRLSHIEKEKSVPLLVSRGKSAIFKVKPLPDDVPAATAVDSVLPHMLDLLKQKWPTDKQAALDYISQAVTHTVTDPSKLSPAEVQKVFRALEAEPTSDDDPDPTFDLDGAQ